MSSKNKLIKRLSELYSRPEDIQHLEKVASHSTTHSSSNEPQDIWANVLKGSSNAKVQQLIELVHAEHPEDQLLSDAIASEGIRNIVLKQTVSSRIAGIRDFGRDDLKQLVQADRLKQSLNQLSRIGEYLTDDFGNNIILLQARYNRLNSTYHSGQMTAEAYQVKRNQLSSAILYYIDQIDDEQRVIQAVHNLTHGLQQRAANNLVIETDAFEKQIGQHLELYEIFWLQDALKAAKSVCKVTLADGAVGTGWIYQGEYIITNKHVIPDSATAQKTTIKLNYQLGEDRPKAYRLSPDRGFYSSLGPFYDDNTKRPEKDFLDYSCIRIEADADLHSFGSLEIAHNQHPAKGDLINIIQHPGGGVKKIAMLKEVSNISLQNQRLYYQADTLGGSSGSPVFNQDWQVVALHNAATSYNPDGEKEDANKGVLIDAIVDGINQQMRH